MSCKINMFYWLLLITPKHISKFSKRETQGSGDQASRHYIHTHIQYDIYFMLNTHTYIHTHTGRNKGERRNKKEKRVNRRRNKRRPQEKQSKMLITIFIYLLHELQNKYVLLATTYNTKTH